LGWDWSCCARLDAHSRISAASEKGSHFIAKLLAGSLLASVRINVIQQERSFQRSGMGGYKNAELSLLDRLSTEPKPTI
jgi:hypothetical protein